MAAIQNTGRPSLEIIRRGQQDAAPAWRRLRCGLLDVHFDRLNGGLRSLRVDGQEVVRAIYAAVRDRNWGTVLPRIDKPGIAEEARSFRISFEAECVAAGIEFRWRGEIVGEENGVLRFGFSGEALTGFWRNRIGICVLHPIEGCVGELCRIETVDGIVTEEMFPGSIAPDQPFRKVRAITHGAGFGRSIEVRFDGETFETEDQRNWTDASFKTYGTPLSEAFPVWVERGTRVEQTVTVRLLGSPPSHSPPRRENAECPELSASDAAPRRLPPIGLCSASHGALLTRIEAERLQKVRPAHLRVDLHMREASWLARWVQAGHEAVAIGAALHVAVFVSDNAEQELAALAAEFSRRPQPVTLWLIFHENEPATCARWVRMAEAALPAGASFAAGTNANFAELNGARPDATETALPCFPMNPQVHVFDDASLIENLGAQAATVESARQFAPRPVVLSPITLRPRFNAVATSADEVASDELPSQVDARQMSLFAAAWTTGSLSRLAALDGIHSLTYFETTGWRGLMECAAGSPMPELFPSLPGCVFPMFHVFAALAEGEWIVPTSSTHPLLLDGFCTIGHDGLRRWGIANLTAIPRRVRVALGDSAARVRTLDETNALRAMLEPENFADAILHRTSSGILELELNAYAFAQITVES